MVTTGKIRRAEMKRQLRVAQQLKVVTLTIVAMLLLAAYPVYLFVRSGSQDPVFSDLDSLDLPELGRDDSRRRGTGQPVVHRRVPFPYPHLEFAACAGRDRHARTGRPSRTRAGAPRAGTCPPAVEGLASCWKRDEYVMDMWVRTPICDVPPPRPTITPPKRGATPKPAATTPAGAGRAGWAVPGRAGDDAGLQRDLVPGRSDR